ncbi:MAG: hypothetical protein U5S82_19840 [Gammaproteobacteria bacterium]|nr:hypothetical protein [Gammaproteobacteria bacterium]
MTDKDYRCLRDLICHERIPVAEIATVVEEEGALWLDGVGRFRSAHDSEKKAILEELNTVYKHQQMTGGSPSDNYVSGAYFFGLEEMGTDADEYGHPLLRARLVLDENRKLSGPRKKPLDKDLHPKERKSLLRIVAALCKKQNIDCHKRGAATELVQVTERLGQPVSHGTIEKFLKEIRDDLDLE